MLSSPGLIPQEPIWEQMEGPGPLATAAPAQLGCGWAQAAAHTPSLVTGASLGDHDLGIPITTESDGACGQQVPWVQGKGWKRPVPAWGQCGSPGGGSGPP